MTDVATETAPDIGSEADRTLTITRRIAVPCDSVFRAWSDPAELTKWWGPEGTTPVIDVMDVRPGGAWRTRMVNAQGQEYICSGIYREIAAPERLSFTWAWETDGVRGHETVVTIEFKDSDGGTEMVLNQRLFETSEGTRMHNEGWTSSLDRLQQSLAG